MEIPPEDLANLTRVERTALAFASWINESPRARTATHWINKNVHRHFVTLLTSRRIHLVGMDRMAALRPDRGVLIASNHRTYFDQYIIATYLYRHVVHWNQFFFPVRSGFLYDTVPGILANLLFSTMSMFPPIFRPRHKRGVTRAGLDFLAERLKSPRALVGIHPEGTRNKNDDPYELLPAEPGFGRVVLHARPIVIPIFVNGLSDSPAEEVRLNLRGRRPVIVVYGDPVDTSEFDGVDPRLFRNQVKVGRKVLDAVARLGEIERRERERLTRA